MNWLQQFFSQQPDEAKLRAWAHCAWVEYQAWVFHHSFLSKYEWQQQRLAATKLTYKPLISIVTPVYNTDPKQLDECIHAVKLQTYPYWQWCIVDDGSNSAATLAKLRNLRNLLDKRIIIAYHKHNKGLCAATNHAINLAQGEYIAFLDHDDRLAVDALFWVAKAICAKPKLDLIYSDRDMLSIDDQRYMHLFKPQWAPETLLSGNYLFHLTVYKANLIAELAGVREEYSGSQDYDLVLRASDKALNVQHIPRILYHWRQHAGSIANPNTRKDHVYTAGKQALLDTLQRRGLTAQVAENTTLWRGNYQVNLACKYTYTVINLTHFEHYASQINHYFQTTQTDCLIFLTMPYSAENLLQQLVSWLSIDAVGMVTGKIIDPIGNLLHAGMVQRLDAPPLLVYAGFPADNAGYMAVTQIVRNVSAPHPACFAIKRQIWQQLGGLNANYTSVYALLDFSLRALQQGIRTVYNPQACFTALHWWEMWQHPEMQEFSNNWRDWLIQGDPYYNPNLTLSLRDMGLRNDYYKI
jgi:O-antigen biosynthesis protein